MLNAVYLSLFNYRLTVPSHPSFLGLRNYGVILTHHLWWQDVLTTSDHRGVVAVELVIGLLRTGDAPHRRGRRTVRTASCCRTGSSPSCRRTPGSTRGRQRLGLLSTLVPLGTLNWSGHRRSSLVVICLSEIWKTTPFIALLLLAGLAQVPDVLLEAASVDGATAWQRLGR